MANLFASFGTGVSGLRAAQTSLNTTAHNLANATTEGHTRQQTIMVDHYYSTTYGNHENYLQVGLGTDIALVRQVRNEFLDDNYRLEVGRKKFYEAQSETAMEIQSLFGELEGEQFSVTIQNVWKALQELQKEPESLVKKDLLVSVCSTFVERANVVRDQLLNYQVNLNQDIELKVKRINQIAQGIKECNDKIKRVEVSGEQANDYRDTRNLLLDELGSYMDFDVAEEIDGTMSVYVEGQYLVSTDRAYSLATERISDTSNMLKVVWADNGAGDFLSPDSLSYSMESNTDVGSLKGLLIARGNATTNYTDIPVRPTQSDFATQAEYQQALNQFNAALDVYNQKVDPSIMMTVQAQFDSLVHGIVTKINDTLCPNKEVKLQNGETITILDTANCPQGDDENHTIGTELFVRKSTPRYTKENVTLEDGTNVEVYRYNEEDPSDIYSLYTISELQVNPDVLKNASLLPLMANGSSGNAEGYPSEVIGKVLENWNKDLGTMDPNSLSTYKINDFYDAMIIGIGIKGQVFNSIVTNQEGLVNNIDSERQMVMGVSSDEELVSLIKYQHSYNASSRYITVIDEMIEHLIERLG
ncbi:MAG: flagellar hook-associated protein FlgK [Lachnospiraceae bacterium]|nr:flagellar hook-associated protein FlgK [Lachnospiraceae bacterium]